MTTNPTNEHDERVDIRIGDCIESIRQMPDNSIDSIVTDPPYEIGVMGRSWDSTAIAYSVELWGECLRVLKPGGHLLAFGATRTYHRMAVAIEDAGFEIRDSIHWVYGSGFPKSLDISKAIDRQRHDREDVYRVTTWLLEQRKKAGVTNSEIDEAFGRHGMAGHWLASRDNSQPHVPTLDDIPKLLGLLKVADDDVPDEIRRLLFDLNGRKNQPGENWAKREITGHHDHAAAASSWRANYTDNIETAEAKERRDIPATAEAEQWAGWGTALKPAHEPIVLARKRFTGTTTTSVLERGTGALNIDGCRIGTTDKIATATNPNLRGGAYGADNSNRERDTTYTPSDLGRWPTNIIFDEDAGRDLDDNAGFEAARFFYCPKPSKQEREAGVRDVGTRHPTMKPVALMQYLIRLVTPPNGTVLDPFAGSGTTLVAAAIEGMHGIGCELTEEYIPIIRGRVTYILDGGRLDYEPEPEMDGQMALFDF